MAEAEVAAAEGDEEARMPTTNPICLRLNAIAVTKKATSLLIVKKTKTTKNKIDALFTVKKKKKKTTF